MKVKVYISTHLTNAVYPLSPVQPCASLFLVTWPMLWCPGLWMWSCIFCHLPPFPSLPLLPIQESGQDTSPEVWDAGSESYVQWLDSGIALGQSWPTQGNGTPPGACPRWTSPSDTPVSALIYVALFVLHSSGKITKNVTESNFNLSSTLVNDVYLRHPLKAHEVN